MFRSCFQKWHCVRGCAAVFPKKYHHYGEERIVSPNNYYSKELASESVSPQISSVVGCSSANDIRAIAKQLADIQSVQASQTTAITELQQRPSVKLNIIRVENKLDRLSLQLTISTMVIWGLYLLR